MQILTVTGYKGGVAKSTAAVHLAAFFSDQGKTLLVDGDPNRTALSWSHRGHLPFTVADERQAMKLVAGNEFVVCRSKSKLVRSSSQLSDLLISPNRWLAQVTKRLISIVGLSGKSLLSSFLIPVIYLFRITEHSG